VAALAGLLVLGYGFGEWAGGRREPERETREAPKATPVPVRPEAVTVAVLNGTTVPGLAAALREELAAAGFKRGAIDVFVDQQLADSVVQYAPGHRAAAVLVGRRLGIRRRTSRTADSRALAGDADVIVIAGTDQAP
jgi:hypothetical protein